MTDAAGNTSAASNAVTGKIDTIAPTAATLVQGSGTNSKVLTLTGVETGGTVKILNGTTDVTSKFTVGTNGTYTANVGAFTGAETFSLTAMVTDALGNTSAASNAVTGKIDTTTPNTPVITTTTSSTKNTKPSITGTAEANSTITLYDGVTVLGTTTASATGAWTFTPSSDLIQGKHTIVAIATDTAGNVSGGSLSIILTIDVVTSTLTWSPDQANGNELKASTGNIKSNTATVSQTVSLAGGATYSFYAGYYYSYSGTVPTITLKILDSSNIVVGSTTSLTNGYTFTAISSGVYTLQLSAVSNASSTAVLTNYNISAYQKLSNLPSTSGDKNVDAVLAGSIYWFHNAGSIATVSNNSSYLIHSVGPNTLATQTDYTIVGKLSSLTPDSSKHNLKYSFLTSLPLTAAPEDKDGFTEMNAIQKAAVKKALDYYSSLLNVTFTQVNDSNLADFSLGMNDQKGISAGYASYPNNAAGQGSYLFLSTADDTNKTFNPGEYGWETLLHEIGHIMGLKHPGNYNAGGGGTEGPYLPLLTDFTRYSIMSYNGSVDSFDTNSWSNIEPQSLMLYDIEALQYLYGSNKAISYQTISFTSSYVGMQTIWAPNGGKIDASAMSNSNIIDLRGGSYSSICIQRPSTDPNQTYMGMNNVAIAYGSNLNDASGGSGNDVFYANDGNDIIDGGAGIDIVYLSGSSLDWTFSVLGSIKTATNKKTGSIDTLKNIENISYYDPVNTAMTHTASTGMLSQTVSAFIQSVASMAPHNTSSTIIQDNGGMPMEAIINLTQSL